MKTYRIYSQSSGSFTISVDGIKAEEYIVCPICSAYRKQEHKSEKKLNVNLDKQVWRCNHCGEGGHLYEKDDIQLRKELIQNRGLTPLAKPKGTTNPIGEKIMDWVRNERKISEKALYALRWRQAEASFRNENGTFTKRQALAFMVYIDGVLINIHYRDSHKNFTREKAADTVPYNWDSVKGKKKVFLVEGEMDVGAIYSIVDIKPGWIGEIGCASVPNGTTITAAERAEFEETGDITVDKPLKLEWLTKLYDDLKGAEEIVIATDDDAPGIKLRKELARRLGIERCKYVTFTHRQRRDGKKCKDADDVLMSFSPKELLEDLNAAKLFPSPNILDEETAANDVDDLYKNGMAHGLSIGFPSMDGHCTLQKGHPGAIYGWPGNGKTTVALNMLMNMAVLHGWIGGVYCPENYPPKLLIATLMEIYAGKSFDKSAKDAVKMSRSEYEKAKSFVLSHFKFLDNPDGFTLKELIKEAKGLIRRYDIDFLYIDPWNSLNLDSTVEVDKTNRNMNEIVRFAVNNNVCTLISVHPNTPDKKMDKSQQPSVFQLEGGLIWMKKMYFMICVHQLPKENNSWQYDTSFDFDVTKNKWHKTMGIPTSVTGKPIKLKFARTSNRVLELDGYSPIQPGSKARRTREDQQLELTMAEKNAVVDENDDWV